MKAPQINTTIFLLFISMFAFGIMQQINQQKQTRLLMHLVMKSGSGGGDGKKKTDEFIMGVKNQILKSYPAIKKHYFVYLAEKPELIGGNILIDWEIGTDGMAIRPQVVTSSFQNKDFENSIISEIKKITFPAPPIKRYMTHTFRFQDANAKPVKPEIKNMMHK